MNSTLQDLMKLPRAERLQLVEDLWDSIASENEPLAVSSEKLAEIERRRELPLKDPTDVFSWDQVAQFARTQHD